MVGSYHFLHCVSPKGFFILVFGVLLDKKVCILVFVIIFGYVQNVLL